MSTLVVSFFIDEMGAYLNMTLNYARSPIGQRVHMPKPFNRGMTLSVIGAISTTRVEASI